MTKTISTTLKAHIAQTVTTLCTLWKLTRTDGAKFYFTDHDQDVVFDGNTYVSATAYNRTNVVNNSTLAVDNLEITGIFDSSEIKESELRAGLYNYARIDVSIMNWADTTQGSMTVRTGWLGEVILTPQGWFQAEMRGMSQALAQIIGEVYQPSCRADLGDSRCKVPIKPSLRQNKTFYDLGDYIRVATDGGVVTTFNGEPTQDAYQNRIYKCTSPGYTGYTQPVYDTAIGNGTAETGLKAEAWALFCADTVAAIANADTLTVGTKVYTFQTVLTDVDGHVQIGIDNQATRDNFVAAVNLGAGAGTAYATSTTANTDVVATALTPGIYRTLGQNEYPVYLQDLAYGDAGNSVALNTSNSTRMKWVDINDPWFTNGHVGSLAALTFLINGQDGATFQAFDAWTRDAVVASVVDHRTFSITVSEARAIDRWFANGAITFMTGNNTGFSTEIKNWTLSGSVVQLFLTAPFTILPGDKLSIYRGCNKSPDDCFTVFDNILNFRGEPFVPGSDSLTVYPNAP